LAMRGKKVEHNPVYFKIISNYFWAQLFHKI
jgi:hypothetical protein